MSVFNKDWKYTPASKMTPGYLREKFARIRKQQRDALKRRVVVLPRPTHKATG